MIALGFVSRALGPSDVTGRSRKALLMLRPRTLPCWVFLLGAALLLLVGPSCSSKKKEGEKPVFPVRGQVFVQGNPASGAFVLFVPVNEPAEPKDPRPRATVEANGSFALSTYGDKDGAPAGDYIVLVTWPGGEESDDKLQGRYGNAKTSPLKAEVKGAANDLPPYQLK
jgi:hypothetical protein